MSDAVQVPGPEPDLRLPRKMKPFFWDYNFTSLSWERDRDLIIPRLLEEGDWDAYLWLRARLGDDELRAWLRCRRGRGMGPRQLRFLEVAPDLPEEEVTAWLADSARRIWDVRLNLRQ